MVKIGDELLIDGNRVTVKICEDISGRKVIGGTDNEGNVYIRDHSEFTQQETNDEFDMDPFQVADIFQEENRRQIPFVFSTKNISEGLNEIANISQMSQKLLRENGIIIDTVRNLKGSIVVNALVPERADIIYLANELKSIINRNIKSKVSNQLEEAYVRIVEEFGIYRATIATSISSLKVNAVIASAVGNSITEALRALSDDIEIIEEEIEEEYERLLSDTRDQPGWERSGTITGETGPGSSDESRKRNVKDDSEGVERIDTSVRKGSRLSEKDKRRNGSNDTGKNTKSGVRSVKRSKRNTGNKSNRSGKQNVSSRRRHSKSADSNRKSGK